MMTRMTVLAMGSFFLVAASTLGACSDDAESQQPAAAAYPRAVAVEYKVTSSTGLKEAQVLYGNESGGMAVEDKAAIPFSKKFTRSVKQYDDLKLSVTSPAAGELTTEILVDGKTVETKSFSGTSVVSGSTVYIFP